MLSVLPGRSVRGDSSFAFVTVLLHCDGTNGSSTFTNNATGGATVTANNGAVLTTADFQFGSASGTLKNGVSNNGYLTFSSDTGFAFPGDFTMEAFIKTAANGMDIICTRQNGDSQSLALGIDTGGKVVLNSGGSALGQGTTTVSLGVWHHIAASRTGTSLKAYLDGVQEISITNSTSFLGSGARVGYAPTIGYAIANAFIDEVRVTVGVGRYPAAFTVPVAAFPNS